jgi:hypothetical protein
LVEFIDGNGGNLLSLRCIIFSAIAVASGIASSYAEDGLLPIQETLRAASNGRTIRQKTNGIRVSGPFRKTNGRNWPDFYSTAIRNRIDFSEEMAHFEARVLEEHGFDPWEVSVTEDGIGCRVIVFRSREDGRRLKYEIDYFRPISESYFIAA